LKATLTITTTAIRAMAGVTPDCRGHKPEASGFNKQDTIMQNTISDFSKEMQDYVAGLLESVTVILLNSAATTFATVRV
jgi:hypothetical protein